MRHRKRALPKRLAGRYESDTYATFPCMIRLEAPAEIFSEVKKQKATLSLCVGMKARMLDY
jgi:hypothetical protein